MMLCKQTVVRIKPGLCDWFLQQECFIATFEKEELKVKATVKPSLCEVPPAVGFSTRGRKAWHIWFISVGSRPTHGLFGPLHQNNHRAL